MRCNYIGNNHFINIAVQNLHSLVQERHSRAISEKKIYFVDTRSVRTIHDLIRQIICIRKIENAACVVLIENNDFIASVHTSARVTIKTPVCEWISSVYTVKPNTDELLSACMSVIELKGLTDAQRRIFYLLRAGKSLIKISEQLAISNKTTYAHRQAITELYSFVSPSHLVIYMKNEAQKNNIPLQLC